jgi:pimeloyl-ACP methyl ester carboxylesterase
MAWWRWFLVVIGSVATALIMLALGFFAESRITTDLSQAQLDPFYMTPDPLLGEPGTLLRIEPLDVDVPGGSGFRMLYVSERPDGERAVSGGMVFIPNTPAVSSGRPVVAWAHGTLGQGDACAPSRSRNPLGDTAGWLAQMMSAGWVVTATDYTGLGTEGPNLYLVGEAEVRDVVNSVRAIRQVPEAQAGDSYVVWGHSQGGHSSLWAGHLAPAIAPELNLLGVAAAAPAAELSLIMQEQWQSVVGWVIGPEVIRSWPSYDANLRPDAIVSARGQDLTASLAEECVTMAALDGQAQQALGFDYFSVNPITVPTWRAAAEEQTPPPMPSNVPVFIGQSVTDAVVLGWPNGQLQNAWCAAGSTLETMWVYNVAHQDTAVVIGPDVVRWIADRFAGVPAKRTCAQPPPVSSAADVAAITGP